MNAWTGGQYSLVRVLLAVYLVVRLFPLDVTGALPLASHVLGLATAVAFGLGVQRRAAAVILVVALQLTSPREYVLEFVLALLVFLHAFVPSAPYGSLAARGRPDPAGNWNFPTPIWRLHQLLTAVCLVMVLTVGLVEGPDAAWPNGGTAIFLLLAFAFDPKWVPPRRAADPEVAFYDGECGLCHGFVRLCLSEDRDGGSFRFAPLQGPTFAERVDPALRETLPDSIVLQRPDGKLLVRSSAAAHMLCGLGGYWRILGSMLLLIPPPLRDFGYDTVARFRKLVFAKPEGLCPIVPPHLGQRFLP